MVALNFNARQVTPNASLQPLPSGIYDVMITNTQEKPTKDGAGAYIEFEMTVQSPDPNTNGRKVFDRLNIRNRSEQAVQIAYSTLSAICHVTNRHEIQDTQQLHGIPFKAVVVKKPRGDTPKDARPEDVQYTNEISGYKDTAGNDPGKSGSGAAPAASPGWAGGPPQGQQPQQYAPQPNGQQPPQQQYAPQQQPQPGAPNGGQPGWAAAPQQQQPAAQQPQQQPQQPQPAAFTPGQAPPWAQGGQAAPQ